MNAATPIGRTQHVARGLLHDFAASGVDEDLEMLRAQWSKPPPKPLGYGSSDDDEEAEFVRWPGRPMQLKKPWRGGPPKKRPDPTARVRGGALDYKSGERLETLKMLRTLVASPEADLLSDVSDMTLATVGSGFTARNIGSRADQRAPAVSEIERQARARRARQEPGLDWATWESRWADHLKSLAAAAGRAKRQVEAERREAAGAFRFPSDRYEYECDDEADQEYGTAGGTGPWTSARRPPPRRQPPRKPQPPPSSYAEKERRRQQYQQQGQPQSQQQRQQQQQQQRQQQQQQWQERPPPKSAYSACPPAAKPAPAPPKKTGRFFDSWSQFDAAFIAWEVAAASSDTIRLADVPFPPPGDPAGLNEAGLLRTAGAEAAGQRKKLLRKALLRWHPDKWMRVTGKIDPSEHGELGERLSAITQALVEQKDV